MKWIALILMLFVGSLMFAQQREVLVVEQIFGEDNAGNALFICKTGQEPQKIQLTSYYKDGRIANLKTIQSTFAKLYEEGWHLVGVLGEVSYGRYIFEREKK